VDKFLKPKVVELKYCFYSEKGEKLPDTKFSWFKNFRTIPDEYSLNHNSLDGYLYLRFFKMLTIICFVGCLITWPVLFPVNATGRGGQKQLDILSFSNIGSNEKNKYYAHTFCAWIFMSMREDPIIPYYANK